MSAGFTPGPWRLNGPRKDQVACREQGRGYAVAQAYGLTPTSRSEAEANARLIAAAPELYDALRIFVDDERFQVTLGGNPNVVDQAIAQAHAALAKVRGEQVSA